MSASTKPYSRDHISSSANETEVAYSNRRGWQQLDRSGIEGTFRIQHVSNSYGRPYWDTVDTAATETAAIKIMEALVTANRRTYRVARVEAS